MKQRAPYRCEAFDVEVVEVYGTISAVDTLANTTLRFVGWNEAGTVAWDTASQTSVPATVTVTDAAACTYAATVGPLPADTATNPATNEVYRFEVQRTSAPAAVLVWGFLTITPSPPNNE